MTQAPRPVQRENENVDSSEGLPALDLPEPGGQRRLTVLVRWLLLLPHVIVLCFYGIGALAVLVVGWFAALFTGRLPQGIARNLTGFLGYATRVGAYAMLVVDRFPPFGLGQNDEYPVRIEVRPAALNRWTVLFRGILLFPAAFVGSLVAIGWGVAALIVWLVVLVLGRMPRPLFEATAAILRFNMRCRAYQFMLTPVYPRGFSGDTGVSASAPAVSATRPLIMSQAGKALLFVFLLLGAGYQIAGIWS